MQKLSVATKLAYGVGQVGEQVKSSGFSVLVFFFFNNVLGLSGMLSGLAAFVALVFDAFTDPIAGSLSDNWKSPRGRRHPFMYAAALPLAITWYFLLSPPEGLGQLGLFLWLTTFAILVRGSMTLYHVPHLALGAELSDDYAERTSVVAYRTVFGLIGGVLVTAVGIPIFFPETEGFVNGLENPAGYRGIALFGSAVMLTTIWGSAWGTRSEIPRLAAAPDQPEAFSFRRVFGEFAIAWRNPSFRSLFVGFSFFAVSLGVTQTLGTHVNVFFWEFSAKQVGLLILPFGVGFLIGAVISQALHSRFDKKRTLITATLASFIMGNSGVALRLMGALPENGSPELFAMMLFFLSLLGVGAGIGFTSAGSMMADVAEDQKARTGKAQEGVLFSALSFTSKLASGLGVLVAGVGIDLIAFPVQSHAGEVSQHLVQRLGLLQISAGSIGLFGIYAYTHYTITRADHEEARQTLARGVDAIPSEPEVVPD